jgi:5'-phosphate synthase pdxT subunit
MWPTFPRRTDSLNVAGSSPLIGVLALQGDVREHERVLDALGVAHVAVRTPEELERVDGLIIPGGESTVIDKLTRIFGMREPLRSRIAAGMPVFGTCAGLIMLSNRLSDATHDQQTLGGLDVTVRRNAFGSQVESFETSLSAPEVTSDAVAAAFIRAPLVEQVGSGVRVLATLHDGRIVAVQQGNLLGISFHPEISGDLSFHKYFLGLVADAVAGVHA